MLVGNKTDLAERRQVTSEEGRARAEEEGVMFLETSAKVGANIKALFRKLARALPGMDNGAAEAKRANMIDIKLQAADPKGEEAAMAAAAQGGGCAC